MDTFDNIYLVSKRARPFVTLSALPVSKCYCDYLAMFEISLFLLGEYNYLNYYVPYVVKQLFSYTIKGEKWSSMYFFVFFFLIEV